MPTYEYKCDACGHAFEKFQSIMADAIKTCPQCGKKKVKRLIGMGAGLIFKGSGFYITDYRDAGYNEKAKAESGAASEAKGESKGESKGDSANPQPKHAADSKPAGKSEPASSPKPAEPKRGDSPPEPKSKKE